MEEMINEYLLTPEEKKKYIDAFMPHLTALRAKAGVSQEEISSMIGVSRQTYGAVERNLSDLSWNTFLSLLWFYEYNDKTHETLHQCGAFPTNLIKKINGCSDSDTVDLKLMMSENGKTLLENLDEQAVQSIRTMVMVEYARCSGLSGDAVIKAFEGVSFTVNNSNSEADAALKRIKQKKNRK